MKLMCFLHLLIMLTKLSTFLGHFLFRSPLYDTFIVSLKFVINIIIVRKVSFFPR